MQPVNHVTIAAALLAGTQFRLPRQPRRGEIRKAAPQGRDCPGCKRWIADVQQPCKNRQCACYLQPVGAVPQAIAS